MNGQEMIVLIVLIVIVGRVISAKYGVNAWGKRSRRDIVATPNDVVSIEDGVRMKSEIDRLNARVQVLERLATDPSKRLADQIDALDPDGRRDRLDPDARRDRLDPDARRDRLDPDGRRDRLEADRRRDR